MKRFFHFHPNVSIAALLLALLLLLAACNDAPSSQSTSSQPATTVSVTSAPPRDPGQSDQPTVTTSDGESKPATKIPDSDTPDGSAATSSTLPELTTPIVTTQTDPIVTTPVVTTQTAPIVTTQPTPPVTEPETEENQQSPYAELKRNAKYVLLYDLTAGKTLYSTGDEQVIYPASTTKLLTILFAMTIVDEDTIFTVGSEISIAPSDSSKAKIRKGEKYTFTDIVAALMLPSGNDAAYTLAVTCGRIIADDMTLSNADAITCFMNGLNDYAASLGLTATHFVTPDGYHDDAHVTSIGDILKVALMAKENPLLSRIMATPTYTVTDLAKGRTMTWENSNFLLQEKSQYYYPYATGCKTGFHTPAGACVIATAEKDGQELMVLIFKCSSKNVRFTDAKNFLELGFEQLAK